MAYIFSLMMTLLAEFENRKSFECFYFFFVATSLEIILRVCNLPLRICIVSEKYIIFCVFYQARYYKFNSLILIGLFFSAGVKRKYILPTYRKPVLLFVFTMKHGQHCCACCILFQIGHQNIFCTKLFQLMTTVMMVRTFYLLY